MTSNLKSVLRGPQLVITQVKELLEIFIDFETANKYEMSDTQGSPLGHILERGGGFGTVLKRWIRRRTGRET